MMNELNLSGLTPVITESVDMGAQVTQKLAQLVGRISDLFSDATGSTVVPNWTPKRVQIAERETLRREGYVVEPHYLWSRPAQIREQQAAQNRHRAATHG